MLPPTTAIATNKSVAITGATARLEVNLFCFDCSFVISDFIELKKMLKIFNNTTKLDTAVLWASTSRANL